MNTVSRKRDGRRTQATSASAAGVLHRTPLYSYLCKREITF